MRVVAASVPPVARRCWPPDGRAATPGDASRSPAGALATPPPLPAAYSPGNVLPEAATVVVDRPALGADERSRFAAHLVAGLRNADFATAPTLLDTAAPVLDGVIPLDPYCFAARTSVLDAIGGFDDRYAEHRGHELAWRGHLAGYRVNVAGDIPAAAPPTRDARRLGAADDALVRAYRDTGLIGEPHVPLVSGRRFGRVASRVQFALHEVASR